MTIRFPTFSVETFFNDIKKWIEGGGGVDIVHPESGWSLLHFAAEFQNTVAIEYLIDLGCDLNLRDVQGQTPLHIAVDSEIDRSTQTGEPVEYKATKKLIGLGANTTIRDNQGKTPIDWIDVYGEKAKKEFDDVVG